jgi:DNA-binding response OmpR family regulator
MLAPPDQMEALRNRIDELEALLGLRETLPMMVDGLRPMERKILGVLLRACPRIVSREFIMRATHNHGDESDESDEAVRVHVARIRRLLPRHLIMTANCEGYYIPREAKEELEQFYRGREC